LSKNDFIGVPLIKIMIEDYPKIPYKKNLKMNLYNLKDVWQGQGTRGQKIKTIQGF